MILVADASFAAKALLDEDETDFVRRLWLDDTVTWSAPALLGPEVAGAVAVHRREAPELLSSVSQRLASVHWDAMLSGIAIRAVNRGLAEAATRIVRDHGPIRGADACYVALGLELAASEADVVLGSFDKQQRKAAASAGLAVTPT